MSFEYSSTNIAPETNLVLPESDELPCPNLTNTINPIRFSDPEVEKSIKFIPFLSNYSPETHHFPTVINLINKNPYGRVAFSEENTELELERFFESQIIPILKSAKIDYIGKTIRVIAPDGGGEIKGDAQGRSCSLKITLDRGTRGIYENVDHHNKEIRESSAMQLFRD
jgi:hypothetical protein